MKLKKLIDGMTEKQKKALHKAQAKYVVARWEETIRKNRLEIAGRIKSTQNCLDNLQWFRDVYAEDLK